MYSDNKGRFCWISPETCSEGMTIVFWIYLEQQACCASKGILTSLHREDIDGLSISRSPPCRISVFFRILTLRLPLCCRINKKFFGHFRTAALSNGFRIFHSIERKDQNTLGMEVLINESRYNHSFYAVEDPRISLDTWYHYGATFLMDTQLKLYRDGILVVNLFPRY